MPKLADWAESNLADGFTVFNFPPAHRVRLRNNVAECEAPSIDTR